MTDTKTRLALFDHIEAQVLGEGAKSQFPTVRVESTTNHDALECWMQIGVVLPIENTPQSLQDARLLAIEHLGRSVFAEITDELDGLRRWCVENGLAEHPVVERLDRLAALTLGPPVDETT